MTKPKAQPTASQNEMNAPKYVLEFVRCFSPDANFNQGLPGAYCLKELDSKGKVLRNYINSFDVCNMVFVSTKTYNPNTNQYHLEITDEAKGEHTKAIQRKFQTAEKHAESVMDIRMHYENLYSDSKEAHPYFTGPVSRFSESPDHLRGSPDPMRFSPFNPFQGARTYPNIPSSPHVQTPRFIQDTPRTANPMYSGNYVRNQSVNYGSGDNSIWIETQFGKISVYLIRSQIQPILVLHGMILRQLPELPKGKVEDSKFLVLECLFESFFELLHVGKAFYKIENHEQFTTTAYKFVSDIAALSRALGSGTVKVLQETVTYNTVGNITEVVIKDYMLKSPA